jgi:hypothetical protein
VPIPGDIVDQALSDFVNNSADPLNLIKLFIRETPGTYIFGSKVVSITLENGILFVRHGASYMPLDQFLDIHARSELDKINRGRI